MTSKLSFLELREREVKVITPDGEVSVKTCRELVKLFVKHDILGFTDAFKALAKILTLDSECLRFLREKLGNKHALTNIAELLSDKAEHVLKEIIGSEEKTFREIGDILKDYEGNVVIHGVSNSIVLEELVKSKCKIYIPEFRPYLVQAKLVAKALADNGAKVIVVTDNMVGYLMWKGDVKLMVTEGISFNDKLVGRTGTLTYAIASYYSKAPAYSVSYSIIQSIYTSSMGVPLEESVDVKYLSGELITHEKARTLYAHYDIVPLRYFKRNIFIRVV